MSQYRTAAPRPNWYVVECGPGWAEVVLDNVFESEAKTFAEGRDEKDYGISYHARCDDGGP